MSVRQHRIPDPPPITDRMTDGSHGASSYDLVGRRVVVAYDIPDSDRDETLLRMDDGSVLLLSCDPGYDELGVSRTPEHWETCMYDATDSPAGRAIQDLEEGHWL